MRFRKINWRTQRVLIALLTYLLIGNALAAFHEQLQVQCDTLSPNSTAKVRVLNDPAKRAALRQQVVKRVESAAGYIRQHGRVAAVYAFSNPKGQFSQHGLFVAAAVCNNPGSNGIVLSYPGCKKLVFTNQRRNPMVARFLREIKKSPAGVWINYRWQDPDSTKFFYGHSYALMVPKQHICISSEYYTQVTSAAGNLVNPQ